MKYVRVRKLEFKRDCFVIFPRGVTHRGMVIGMGIDPDYVISAGFVSVSAEEGVQCYGESVGLKTKSLPDDTELLQEQWGTTI